LTLIETIGIIGAAIGGSLLAWQLRSKSKIELLQVFLSFSGAYLLAVTVTHLLPEVFVHGEGERMAFFILIGFFVQLLIVQFTRGIEHGHLHLHQHFGNEYVAGVFFGLSIHAFLEGFPLASNAIDVHNGQHLYYAVLIHKLPEAFSLATVLFFSLKKNYAWLLLSIFILITPAGALAGNLLAEQSESHSISWLIAIVCGSFIHISTTIIFESSGKAHKISMYKFLAIVAGVGIALLSFVI
jgi:zinc transporter ZupT